ncbi:MAG: hypothetical protein COV44_11510 [Deltaproteobacteria bacterium CG11_big_fil_rev_8_21_14_0_20_45_16]|nr:MAG: hypothetical protein COV44_11510 [Deltaproteobacteria bacterium CG11_big_fil_rev_8_21_14_0_20_45_16]
MSREKSKKRRVVVADDSITVQKLVNLTLADTDFEVITALDGHDAGLKIKRLKPDFVLIDADIRETGPLELVELIRADASLLNTHVLLMQSANSKWKSKAEVFDLVIEKPFDSKLLLSALNRLLLEDETTTVTAAPIMNPAKRLEMALADDEPTFVPKAQVDKGPFSSFREADLEEETVTKKITDKPFAQGSGLSSRLEAIANEVTAQTPAEKMPETKEEAKAEEFDTAPHRDLPDFGSDKADSDSEQEDFNQTKIVIPSLASAVIKPDMIDRETIVRQEIRKWVDEQLPAIAERLLKEEFAKLSQKS